MITKQKPKIGFLGIMHGLYDKSQPEIPANQKKFAEDVIKKLSDVADIDFPGVAKDRGMIEEYVAYFNEKKYDGIMLVNLLYSPGMRIVQAFKKNRLPVLLANIQPLPDVTQDWDWSLLTTNQGIHGIQDSSNMLMRLKATRSIITDDWKKDSFKKAFCDWASAAYTASKLKTLKAAVFGRMNGMGDILGDDAAFYRVFGLEINYDDLGTVVDIMDTVTDKEIDKQIEEDKKNFTLDKNLPEKSHRYAAQLQIAFEKFCDQNGYCGFCQQFSIYKGDGRIKQLPILAACNMMAKGYAYSPEGDIHALLLTAIGHLLVGDPHFTEMYSLDYGRDSALLSHMGEGNWKVARKDRPVKLIDRPLDIGDCENPPTPIFSAEPGVGTLVSLVAVEGEQYRLVVAKGTVLDTAEISGIPMNYTFFKPDTGIKQCMNDWLKYGGTHHQILFLGDHTAKMLFLSEILGIECVEI
jgi:L-arabinose isomerase